MDLFEDLGGCAVIAVVGLILLLLVACVAVALLGVAAPDLVGQKGEPVHRIDSELVAEREPWTY